MKPTVFESTMKTTRIRCENLLQTVYSLRVDGHSQTVVWYVLVHESARRQMFAHNYIVFGVFVTVRASEILI